MDSAEESSETEISSPGELPPAKEAWKLLVRDLPDGGSADLRDMGPTLECICGTSLWRILGSFDEEGQLSFYFLDVVCSSCGAVAKARTPEDIADRDW